MFYIDLEQHCQDQVIDESDNFSDHLPLTASVVLPGIHGGISFDANNPNSEVASFGQPLWTSASLDDIRSYQDFLWQSFADTSFHVHLAQCSPSCNSSDHCGQLEDYLSNIICLLHLSAVEISVSKKRQWN